MKENSNIDEGMISECEYHVDYYDICQKTCFYCKDTIEKGKCPKGKCCKDGEQSK